MSVCLFALCSVSVYAQQQPITQKLTDPQSFSMVVLPDPQSYVKFDVNQPLFELVTAWTANNIQRLNMKAVLCTGDLVEQNEMPIPHGVNGNQTSKEQWQAVSRAFERLDNKVPYVLCTGNHDYGYAGRGSQNRMCHLHDYFQTDRNPTWRNTLVSICNNAFGVPSLENAAYEIESETWGKLLIISVEFAPRDEVLTWAKELAASRKYQSHRVILLTHSYLDGDGTHIVDESKAYTMTPANFGKAIWEKLVYPSSNICLVICGHVAYIDEGYEDDSSFTMGANIAQKKVAQMMFNAQTADAKPHGNGGEGWVRTLEFMPDGCTIKVKTFSPLYAISEHTAHLAWRRESYDEFEFKLDPPSKD